MIAVDELRAIAAAKLDDARVLAEHGRADGAAYLCGYAVELALKARICVTLNWKGFPDTRSEFEFLTSLRTHRLEVLLALSGQEDRIRSQHADAWNTVSTWEPESRYKMIGHTSAEEATAMIAAVEILLEVL